MRLNVSKNRLAIAALLLATMAATPGCHWFHKANPLYAKDAQSRPLEVPPDLDLPNTNGAVALPSASASATASATAAAPVAGVSNGFTVSGSRDDAFNKVGDALGKIEGLTIASRAQLLGAYDVSYGGSSFLVRVSATDAGAYVSAVDPRGLPATGEAPVKVIGELKTALGGR